MVAITQVPVQGVGSSSVGAPLSLGGDGSPVLSVSGSTQTTYVFDAVLELDHEQRLEKTHHPVQTSADISSHAYLMPARVSMYVGMSDAMAAYSNGLNSAGALSGSVGASNITASTVAPFTGLSSSKSVNAYQTMLSLQSARQPLTITTRLRIYTNMVITSIAPREDFKTIAGLRMRVEFEQIFTGATSAVPVTARPDATQSTGLGAVSPQPVPKSTQQQFQVPSQLPPTVKNLADPFTFNLTAPIAVPGAGSHSSAAGQKVK
jgi:hypothetical protein